MGILFIVFAVSMAVATFMENDYGAPAARAVIYNARWFELLFLLLVVNLAGQIITFKLYRKGKLTVMLFHLAFIVMVIGAAITRYTGYDGMMGIKEGETSATTYSSGKYIVFGLSGKDGAVAASHSKPFSVTALTDGSYRKTLSAGGEKAELSYVGYRNNVSRGIEEAAGGVPMVSFLATKDMVSGETVILEMGEKTMLGDMSVGFGADADLRVVLDQGSFFLKSSQQLRSTKMTDREVTIHGADSLVPLKPMVVYSIGDYKIVPQKMTLSGLASVVPADGGSGRQGPGALEFRLSGSGKEETVYLWDNPAEDISQWSGTFGNMTATVTYGSRAETLPFTIRLDDFVLERYPGSNSPSSYKSKVTLTDKEEGVEIPFEIYMNHILKHRGYRFYQSSYDPDETGTVLSVNHDPAGMRVTYGGYLLLFLFIILSIINPGSFFRNVGRTYWSSRYRKPATVLLLLAAMSFGSRASAQELILDRKEADSFGEVLAQDQKGRTKPLYTISNDILRKVSRENEFNGLSSMQVFMGYSLDFMHWQSVPLIKVSNAELQTALGLKSDRAAFSDIVTLGTENGYKLAPYIDKAYAKPESKRSRFDKEVIKLDERVNICYMMSRGDFLRLFPMKDSTSHWGTSAEAAGVATTTEDSVFLLNVLPLWAQSVASTGKPVVTPEESRTAIINYQRTHASYDLPSVTKVKAELFYYRAKIFEKLFPGYFTLGLIMIITLLAGIISGKKGASLLMKILVGIAVVAFVFHTLGLGIRWYISGHSPMSNGYESMLFISWVTMLAGFIFSRKSLMALAATAVLAGGTLMVAHLSFMDPEITNLVPVLKSYWLTLHVSVITGSYGFLGLGAILGIIVMIMMLFVNERNREAISATIDELTVINYRSITLGLYFLTIGTFLGAVWANESWGRYWGWDPKETWSLITIVIYSLVTHSRMIPGMKDTYTFNVLSLFAFSSVLMTYFGVNYYLSGLHSYAAGDPVPVPVFVYVAVITLAGLAVAAYLRYKSSGKSVQ